MTNEEKEMLKECQQWKNNLNIRIGFPKKFVENFKGLHPKKEINKFRIVGLIDRDRWNLYEGYRIEDNVYHHCLFRIYHPNQMSEVKNEVKTYSRIQQAPCSNEFIYQKLISIGFSEKSQNFVFCLDYCYLMNFSDFNYALHLLPTNVKNMIILKIARSLDKTLKYMHKVLQLAHRKISAETVIFNLDSNPIITDFSNVYFINDENEIKDEHDLGELIKSIRDFMKLKGEKKEDEQTDEDENEEDEEEDDENNEEKKEMNDGEHWYAGDDANKNKENEEKAKKQKIDDKPEDEFINEIDKFITEHIEYGIKKNEENQNNNS